MSQLLSMLLALENRIRGILKTFGRDVPKGASGLFEKNIRALIMDDGEIVAVIMPLLQARQVARSKRASATCRLLMTMPGVRPVTAVAYVAAPERPDTFKGTGIAGLVLTGGSQPTRRS